MTEGFFPRTSCSLSVGALFYPARREGQSPSPTHPLNASVGADASVRPYAPLACIRRADDPVAVPKISVLPYGGRWKF